MANESLLSGIAIGVASTGVAWLLSLPIKWWWRRPRLRITGSGFGSGGPEMAHHTYSISMSLQPRRFLSRFEDERSLTVRIVRLFDPEIQRFLEPGLPVSPGPNGSRAVISRRASANVQLFEHTVGTEFFDVARPIDRRDKTQLHRFRERRRVFGLEVYDEKQRRHWFRLAVVRTSRGLEVEITEHQEDQPPDGARRFQEAVAIGAPKKYPERGKHPAFTGS